MSGSALALAGLSCVPLQRVLSPRVLAALRSRPFFPGGRAPALGEAPLFPGGGSAQPLLACPGLSDRTTFCGGKQQLRR